MSGIAAHPKGLPPLAGRQADRDDGHGIDAGGCHVGGALHQQQDVAAIADGRREHPADENAIGDWDRGLEVCGLVHLQLAFLGCTLATEVCGLVQKQFASVLCSLTTKGFDPVAPVEFGGR